MSYITLADLAQTPPADDTGAIVAGIVGSVLSAGAAVGTGIIQSETQQKIAKEQFQTDISISRIEAQAMARQAALASMYPPPPPTTLNTTTILVIGGVALVGVAALAIVLSSGGKKRSDAGPPPGYAPPPRMNSGKRK